MRALPYAFAAEIGVWICLPAAHLLSLPEIGLGAASLAALATGFNLWAFRIDAKLSLLDRITLDDVRVQNRLTDAIEGRRKRLVMKRIAIFCLVVLAGVAYWISTSSISFDLRVKCVMIAAAAATSAVAGTILLFQESAAVDERASGIQRYADRAKLSLAAADRLKAAKTATAKKIPKPV